MNWLGFSTLILRRRAYWRWANYCQDHPCFICESKRMCVHRESGVALAIIGRECSATPERDMRGRYTLQEPQRRALADRGAIVEPKPYQDCGELAATAQKGSYSGERGEIRVSKARGLKRQ